MSRFSLGKAASEFETLVLELAKKYAGDNSITDVFVEEEIKDDSVKVINYIKMLEGPRYMKVEYGVSYVMGRGYKGMDLADALNNSHPYFYISLISGYDNSNPAVHISFDALSGKVERWAIRNCHDEKKEKKKKKANEPHHSYTRKHMGEIMPYKSTIAQGLEAFFRTIYEPKAKTAQS